MTIEKITLLSKEEYEKHKDIISLLDSVEWWLIPPGHYPVILKYCVDYKGDVLSDYCDDDPDFGVRPVLLLNLEPSDPEYWCKSEKLVGSRVTYGVFTWTVLEICNGQMSALCDEIIDEHGFDDNDRNNDWDSSELKNWLETEGLGIIEGRVKA